METQPSSPHPPWIREQGFEETSLVGQMGVYGEGMCGYWGKSTGIDDLSWSTRPCLTMGMNGRVAVEVLQIEGRGRPATRCISSLPMSFDLEESTRYAMSH